MEPEKSQYAPPLQESGEKSQGFRPIWILWGCGGMFGLLLLVMGGIFLAAKSALNVGEKEFSPACERYFEKVLSDDYKGAYGDFAPEMKATVKEEDYVALDRGIHERLGALKSKKVLSVQAGVDASGRWGVIVYQGEFEKGQGTIRVQLRKVGEEYKMIGVYYNSPVLAESLKSKQP